MYKNLLIVVAVFMSCNTSTSQELARTYCSRVVILDNVEISLYSQTMFRYRISELDGNPFPEKYNIPFVIGHLGDWDEVANDLKEDEDFFYLNTESIQIRISKLDKAWSVWTLDSKTRIHPSEGPVYGMFKNGYTVFDNVGAFGEKNNNDRYTHWFYNQKTKNYTDVYLAENLISDEYFIYGPDYPSLFKQFNSLVGPEPLLPKKAYGFMQTQHLSCEGTQKELMNVAREFRTRDIPIDNLIFDFEWGDGCEGFKEITWGSKLDWSENYSKPLSATKMLSDLDSMNYDVMLIRHNAPDFKNRTGQGWTETIVEENEWWQAFRQRNDEGVDGTWQDTRQNDITDSRIWTQMQNDLGEDARVFFMGCRKMQSVNPWDFRFSTIPVNQIIGSRRYPFDWTGDASFSWNEFKWQIGAITNTHGSMKGVSYIASDAVGANWKIQARWNQFVDFSPISRSHNPKPWSGDIDVKNFENKIRITGRDTVETIKASKAISNDQPTAEESIRIHRKLRYKLLPYIYSYAFENYLTGMPICRPMVLAFPDDYLCNADNWPYQYMFGNEILVAPVYGDFNTMEIYLPRAHDWVDFWSGDVYNGGGLVSYNTSDINKLPLFIKSGAILPERQESNWIEPNIPDTLTFSIYPSDSSSFILYEDDNRSIDYQNGSYSQTKLTCITYDNLNVHIKVNKSIGNFQTKRERHEVLFKVKVSSASMDAVTLNGSKMKKLASGKTHLKKGHWTFSQDRNFVLIKIDLNTSNDNVIVLWK